MAEDGCINNAIFQNIDILGKVEFKDFVSSGSSTFGTSTGEIITIDGGFTSTT